MKKRKEKLPPAEQLETLEAHIKGFKPKRELSTTQIIAVGFLGAIFAGALLLCLPIATATGEPAPFIDALFTSVSSVCVTGLTVVDVFSYWSVFGQIVILLLIQLGGLGVVTITTAIMVLIGRRVTLKDRLLLEEAFNMNTLSGLVSFMKRMLKGVFIIEGIGFAGYCFVFVPEFGPRGVWISLFNSVSAFCNAGMDIIGPTSLAPYVGNLTVNFITSFLIIMGGIGVIVWWDIARVVGGIRKGDIHRRRIFNALSLHTKIVLTSTLVLLLGGAIAIFALEYGNPETLGALPFGQKLMAAFFQSVTTRTAGFFTISQKGMTEATALLCMVLMFIGGSPVGTAGGMKTTTIVLALLSAFTYAKGSPGIEVFGRSIPNSTIRKALGVTVIGIIVAFVATAALCAVSGGSITDAGFEAASAIGTVGLSRDYTRTMNVAGKLLVSLLMYLGRIGPISLVIAFNFRKGDIGVKFPSEEVTVG